MALARFLAYPNPSLGRETDDIRAVLARVRRELASFQKH